MKNNKNIYKYTLYSTNAYQEKLLCQRVYIYIFFNRVRVYIYKFGNSALEIARGPFRVPMYER